MKTHQTLTEAQRLYQLGFAIHWLKERSKAPVKNGAFNRPKEPWAQLEKEFDETYNVGVRIGSPSKLSNGYLACIDVDVHDERYRKIAETKLREIIGTKKLPTVKSGGGNGSRHLYCATKKPISPPITVEKHKGQWEIVIYSEGRQMALPPSTHPDTGKKYAWEIPVGVSLPLMDFSELERERETVKAAKGKAATGGREILNDFECDESLDVRWMPEITEATRKLIVSGIKKDGKRVEDRSAYLLPVASSLAKSGLDKNTVLTVLTDPSTYLGKCAYDHAKTKSRKRAAEWLWSYTVKRVFGERAQIRAMLNAEPVAEVTLGSFDMETQAEELGERDWRQDLVRCGKDLINVKPCLENIVLILENAVGSCVAKRDVFAFRDVYGMTTPWGGVEDELITDDDIVKLRYWLASAWRLDVGKDLLYDAMTLIACKNQFDPVVMWLDGLPAWDKVPRLDTWLAKHFEAQGSPEYLAQVFRKWIVAMIARQYEPGVKFDWMPIFEGVQGVGKSSFGRLLVGDKHFLDWLPDLADKDSALALQGMWGVELGELATMKRHDIEVIKGYITRTVDKFRPPFGKKTVEMPRRCVFYGTTNREAYLRDETGNRRFKPVMVGALDFEALERDRDQLFAEAKWLWDNFIETPVSLDTDGDARTYELEIQSEKMVQDDSDVMADVIDKFFADQVKAGEAVINPAKIGIGMLFSGIGPIPKTPLNARNAQFAGRALKKLGAEKWKSDGRNFWRLPKKYTIRDSSGIGKSKTYPCNEIADFFGENDDF